MTAKPRAVEDRWRRWARSFEKRHPQIHLELLPWPMLGTVPSQAMGEFDLIEAPAHDYALYEPEGGWCGMDVIASARLRKDGSDIPAALWQDARVENRLIGVPFGATVPCLVVNRELWGESGLRETPVQWTWDECLAVAERICSRTGGPAFAMTNVSVLLTSCGYDVYNSSATQSLARTAAILDWFCRMAEVFNTRYVLEPVAIGRIPFSAVMSCTLPQLQVRHAGQVTLLPYPCQSDGWTHRVAVSILGTAEMADVRAGWTVMENLISPATQQLLVQNRNLIPACSSARPIYEDDPSYGDLRFLTAALDRSRPLHHSDVELLQIESGILGPSFMEWYAARRVKESDLARLSERLAEFLEQQRSLTGDGAFLPQKSF